MLIYEIIIEFESKTTKISLSNNSILLTFDENLITSPIGNHPV